MARSLATGYHCKKLWLDHCNWLWLDDFNCLWLNTGNWISLQVAVARSLQATRSVQLAIARSLQLAMTRSLQLAMTRSLQLALAISAQVIWLDHCMWLRIDHCNWLWDGKITKSNLARSLQLVIARYRSLIKIWLWLNHLQLTVARSLPVCYGNLLENAKQQVSNIEIELQTAGMCNGAI